MRPTFVSQRAADFNFAEGNLNSDNLTVGRWPKLNEEILKPRNITHCVLIKWHGFSLQNYPEKSNLG
jgi:hypothetical protein